MLHVQLQKLHKQQITTVSSTIAVHLSIQDFLENYLHSRLKTYGKCIWDSTKDTGKGKGFIISFGGKKLERKFTDKTGIYQNVAGGYLAKLWAEMDRWPGDRLGTVDYPKVCNNPGQDNRHTKSIRTQYHQLGPCPEALPKQLPETWPKCLERGVPLKCESQPPSPALSSTSSDSSGPPSLESISEPESRYEASISSNID